MNNNNSEKQQSHNNNNDDDDDVDCNGLPELLNLNVTGACRVDERLKPLLNKVSSEDRLLSHLTQHFDLSEVGLLARCLCIPLVSLRIGRITKQGTLLVPTTA
nr:hypothetical protein [Tanacetum cinerariifolium]